MPNSLQGAIDYARSHLTRDGGSWAGWCASFVYRAGAFSRSFYNAMAAGDASGPLNGNPYSAPAGAIHYWAGVGGDGHVAFELGGSTLLMASNAVTDRWGVALGTVSFATYARLGIPYRGWTMRWGNETLSGTDVAGFDPVPVDDSVLAGLSQYDQELTRNTSVEVVERVRKLEATLSDISGRLRMPNYPFDYLPAISNNLGALTSFLSKVNPEMKISQDDLQQLKQNINSELLIEIKDAIIDLLPDSPGEDLSKEDLIEAISQLKISA